MRILIREPPRPTITYPEMNCTLGTRFAQECKKDAIKHKFLGENIEESSVKWLLYLCIYL